MLLDEYLLALDTVLLMEPPEDEIPRMVIEQARFNAGIPQDEDLDL